MTHNPPDLAVLVHDLSATGVVRNAIRIAAGAAAAGLGTELWVVDDGGQFRAQVPQNVTVVRLGAGGRGVPRSRSRMVGILAAIPRLAAAIRARKPKVLFSAGNHFHLAGGLAYRLAGRARATRLLGRASNATPRSGRRRGPLGRLANFIDAIKYREMHQIVAVSHELAADLVTRLGIAPERVTVIPNGVDLGQIDRDAAEPLNDPWFAPGAPPVVVSAGRLSKQKNFGLLIDAFARLRRERPARLIILGDGPAAVRWALLDQAARLGVADDVRLPGHEQNPFRYFARARLFVLSSLWEGASNVLIEALACGCPVVATDSSTGTREILDSGTFGTLVPPNDVEALAGAMIDKLDAPRDCEAARRQARQFDLTLSLARYFHLITDPVLEER